VAPRRRIAQLAALGVAGAAIAAGTGVAIGKSVLRSDRRRSLPSPSPAELRPPADVIHRVIGTADGGRVHLLERGSGRPIVLLHGVTLQAAIWAQQLRSLADEHRVIALDQRGHGRSVPGSLGITIEAMAGDLADVLESLELTDAVIVGHSMGSMVALTLAIERPDVVAERVAGIAIVAGTAGLRLPLPGVAWLAGVAGAFGERGLSLLERREVATLPAGDLGYIVTRYAFGTAPKKAYVDLTLEIVREMEAASLAAILPDVIAFDVWDRLAAVEVPMLIAVGSRDRLTPPSHARRLRRAIASSRLLVLEEAGHMLMLERHAALDKDLLRFAREVAPPPGRAALRRGPAGNATR
jgi:pimeloyl-ACP methyl ester carboxylesterase